MQVQTGSYKEAVDGIKMAVTHKCHSEVKLDQAQTDLIQTKLLAAVDMNP
jgi:phosphoglycerate-specific signal transduction histidine kinase